ncbi:RsmB/NOP family class I SAM-dependent RNA methyltransferase [Altererythrobacter xixiisoli]|uniref:RsmB/NOP family class I SAM-dependent RNA methyltransferase n=1 Tax=Croceibacterium xixiisoli TaxID=1476466 RepID=A0A6I4TXL0_9SPHN|nr:RsmB/NOP family class I SAM-dependent RNA methyltransferase [Croceibacterium xixiisoli]MXO99093.1 RsmB/NOP family class I SAM-dependent RNA methyltransferase [Croceibacterium xixiisoli]
MTPAARVAAAIEILDQIIAAARSQGAPADRLLSEWFRQRRFAGSKDRRAIREIVYGAIRACGPLPDSGRAAILRLAQDDAVLLPLFDGSAYGPAPVVPGEPIAAGGIAPAWIEQLLTRSGIADGEAAALLDRAPLDIRVNALRADRATLVLPVSGEHLPAPQGLRLPSGTQVDQWNAYRDGQIEVQDCGSQLACAALDAQPGETIIDLCAGAGGKTLALAAAMQNNGRLIAADTDRSRLSRLAPRAERAGALISETLLLDGGREDRALSPWYDLADAVLVDAPCSGSGTWRRNPEARWRLDPAAFDRLTSLQARILDMAAQLVRPGGRLVFITCSVLDAEGADQVDRFLSARSGWRAVQPDLPLGTARGQGIRLSPMRDGTDGFFIARLEKPW